ncbi:hypothetical protein ACRQ5D_32525 [Mucilaginibacter sp. P25]|uniref:Secreted protein n=1 Tax=Mucilaginibacter gossypii TaxID=551996 RepID=A0A1G8BLS7_9SPHI|nr:hypothetical protein [Mucilaginibacter gossypii]SDH34131.1 hypothetical protein SAMN05192573_1096 [Mucilaginibacter gossypii]
MKILKKNFSKIVATFVLVGSGIVLPAKSNATVQYCWGSLRTVQGISVCDGAANNCTHPCTVAN